MAVIDHHTDVPSYSLRSTVVFGSCPFCFEIARWSSFSVGLPPSSCPIVSIVSVFYDQYTLASHSSHYRSTIKYIPMTNNTSKFEQLLQRRPERSLAHEDFVRLSFAKPIGRLQYRDIEKNRHARRACVYH